VTDGLTPQLAVIKCLLPPSVSVTRTMAWPGHKTSLEELDNHESIATIRQVDGSDVNWIDTSLRCAGGRHAQGSVTNPVQPTHDADHTIISIEYGVRCGVPSLTLLSGDSSSLRSTCISQTHYSMTAHDPRPMGEGTEVRSQEPPRQPASYDNAPRLHWHPGSNDVPCSVPFR
jgi:hypothetical protein